MNEWQGCVPGQFSSLIPKGSEREPAEHAALHPTAPCSTHAHMDTLLANACPTGPANCGELHGLEIMSDASSQQLDSSQHQCVKGFGAGTTSRPPSVPWGWMSAPGNDSSSTACRNSVGTGEAQPCMGVPYLPSVALGDTVTIPMDATESGGDLL